MRIELRCVAFCHFCRRFLTPLRVSASVAIGVPGITQCPIGPGEEFLYEFKLDAPGTLWWHRYVTDPFVSMTGVALHE